MINFDRDTSFSDLKGTLEANLVCLCTHPRKLSEEEFSTVHTYGNAELANKAMQEFGYSAASAIFVECEHFAGWAIKINDRSQYIPRHRQRA